MNKFNSGAIQGLNIVILGILLFLMHQSIVYSAWKGNDFIILTVDEKSQLYDDYNNMDDVYDTVSFIRKLTSDTTSMMLTLAQSENMEESEKVYSAGSSADDLAFYLGKLSQQHEELNGRKILSIMKKAKELIDKIVGIAYEEYNSYQTVRYEVSKDKMDLEVLKKEQKRFSILNEQYDELNGAYIEEQQKLIAYNKYLRDEIT